MDKAGSCPILGVHTANEAGLMEDTRLIQSKALVDDARCLVADLITEQPHDTLVAERRMVLTSARRHLNDAIKDLIRLEEL